MGNKTNRDLKRRFAAMTGKAISAASGFVVRIPCFGDWYEPKVPAQLQKK
ncbi:MAG TPA: hypothetical protein IAD07_11295 [Candidatus Fimivicinus intestinavium]|mgnify:CR=1 FL=1|nr:hypothetical protein [Candidatus Fimivicinus intestinavium]